MQLVSEQFEEIQKVILDLKRESERDDTRIIVEGKKDLRALRNLGIVKNLIKLEGRSLVEICDQVDSFKNVIILTDFDNSGQKWAKDLQANLSSRGINADLSHRRNLKFYFKKVSKDIESLFTIYQQVQQKKLKK